MAAVKKKTTKKTSTKPKPTTAPKTAAKAKPKKPKGAPPPTAAEIKAWRAASQRVDFRLEILTSDGIQTVSGNTAVPAGRWFAAVPLVPVARRYHFVLQWQGISKKFVLVHLVDGAGAARLPPAGGWSRALDAGKIHVIASDMLLTRRQIAAIIGGHEGSTGVAKPPNT
jgi:hypothetical protein